MAGLSQTEAAVLVARHVASFNAAVASRDYSEFLHLFADDAVIRFDNLPDGGALEFAGRDAYTDAYLQRPPEDEIDITGIAQAHGDELTVPFAWRHDGAPGALRLTYSPGSAVCLDERLVTAMTVSLG